MNLPPPQFPTREIAAVFVFTRMIKEAFQTIREFFDTSANAITRYASSYWSRLSGWNSPRYSWDRPDYEFWRRVYFCRAKGLELSGLFVKPLVNKVTAWTLGRPPHWSIEESETAEEALMQWWTDNHPSILEARKASLKEGDAFAVINPDLTMTIVPADLVEPIVSEQDYSDVVGWRVTQTYPHPTRKYDKQVVIDEYTAGGRTRIWMVNGKEQAREVWPNLIGRLSVVHIPNQRQAGEAFGHPEAEALVTALQRYGATLDAAIDGNQLQGRPTPVLRFETVEGYNQFWNDYGTTENQILPDGTSQAVPMLNVDLSQILAAVGADFSYESPGSFAADTMTLLEVLFLLILEHTELPEFVFGNAITSSKASAETQMPVFIRFIELRRAEMVAWLTDIAEIALAYLSLVTPGVGTAESPVLQWEQLEQDDGRLTLDVVTWAYTEGLLDAKTALMLAPIEVEDIETVLEQAKKERQERQQEMDETEQTMARLFNKEIAANER